MSLADCYSIIGNFNTADEYYKKSIDILRKTSDSIALGSALLNAGDFQLTNKKFESALTYFTESGKIFEAIDYSSGIAYNYGNVVWLMLN